MQFPPHLTEQENHTLPHSPLQATSPFSPSYTSGTITASHIQFPPHLTEQENHNLPHSPLQTTSPLFPILHIRKSPNCPTLPSTPHPHFPHPTHQERNRPPTHFYLLICNIGAITLRKSKAQSEPPIELGSALCFSRRRSFIPAAVRKSVVLAHGQGKICNRCAEWAFLRTN